MTIAPRGADTRAARLRLVFLRYGLAVRATDAAWRRDTTLPRGYIEFLWT
jgi:hypothetical protein